MEEYNKTRNAVIIYGDSDFAEQVYYQIESDGRYKVLAFTVDGQKFRKDSFLGLPVIPFQELLQKFSVEDVLLFVAIGYSKLNTIREMVISEIEQAGYSLLTYISEKAQISCSAKVDSGCYICEFVSIGANSRIGKSTMVLPHASIAHDVNISSYSYISRSTTIGGSASIRNNTFLGLGAIIRNSITIEEFNVIGTASNIVKSTDPYGIYVGNPAKRLKDVDLNNLKF